MKQKVILIAAVIVGLFAFWLTHQYLREERRKLYAGVEQVRVIVAARDLPAGTVLKMEDLGAKSVFKSQVGSQVYRPEEIDAVLGKRLRYAKQRNDALDWSDVDVPERMRGGLAPMVRSGLRAVSLAIGGEAAVSGLVQPNDRVDILGTFTMPSRTQPGLMETVTFTILQDVTVLATGTRIGKSEIGMPMTSAMEARSTGYSSVTLLVTPREAELLVFAETMKGGLTLTLRNPDDVGFEKELPEVNFQYFEKKLPELNQFRQQTIWHKQEP